MRRVLFLVTALIGAGAYSPAIAEGSNCKQAETKCSERCILRYNSDAVMGKCMDVCARASAACEFTDTRTFDAAGNFTRFDHERSHPKQVNGQSQRTADGSIVMVTPEGKEWLWNGKYNTVIDKVPGTTGTITRSHTVMQGDPNAPWTHVNGKNMQVSDPRYMAEVEAERVKNNVVVRDHRTPKPKSTPPAPGASVGGATATHGAAGQAPSSASAGSTATNTGGSYVRNHDTGAKSVPAVPPPSAIASGIDKRPGRNAQ